MNRQSGKGARAEWHLLNNLFLINQHATGGSDLENSIRVAALNNKQA